MGLYFSILVVAFLLTGCTSDADIKYTEWLSAAVNRYCGGVVSIPASGKPERARYGMYINNKDNINMDLIFVDLLSYRPGDVFAPLPSNDPNYVPSYTVTKSVPQIETAFWEEDGLQNLMSEIAGKVSNKPVTGCKVVTTEEDFCWLLGDGVTACSANIECKDSMNVFVTYVFKGATTDPCPDQNLLLGYLLRQNVKADVKIEDEKKQKEDTSPVIKYPERKEDTTPKQEDVKSGRQVS
jgi:hypothetical protein